MAVFDTAQFNYKSGAVCTRACGPMESGKGSSLNWEGVEALSKLNVSTTK